MITKEVSQAFQELANSQAELNRTVNKWIGRVGNQIGEIIELILVPGIRQKMSEHEHSFTSLSAKKVCFTEKGEVYTEIDVLLENCGEAMAVEVKTHLRASDISEHIERLENLRKHEDMNGLKGKKLYAAVAALEFEWTAQKKAEELGMYIIKMSENNNYINVVCPEKGIKCW